jgi:hypothetical protein
MISEHIKRNTYYTIVLNQSDAESIYAAIRHMQIDPRCSKMISSFLPGYGIVMQTQASWSSAFAAKLDFVDIVRNTGAIEYNQHDFVPASNAEQTQKIINELYKFVSQNKNENKGKTQNKKSDIEKLALKLIKLWAKNPYTPVVRLFERLGGIHYKVQADIRQYLEHQQTWATFGEGRIGRSPMLLMEITKEGYKALQISMPKGNKGRGGIVHRHFVHWIKQYFEARGYRVLLEWIATGTNHPVDLMIEKNGHVFAYEIAITAFNNLGSHLEACFETSTVIEKLTIVVTAKTKMNELKKIMKNNLMLARYKDKIQLDVVGNYMNRSSTVRS